MLRKPLNFQKYSDILYIYICIPSVCSLTIFIATIVAQATIMFAWIISQLHVYSCYFFIHIIKATNNIPTLWFSKKYLFFFLE